MELSFEKSETKQFYKKLQICLREDVSFLDSKKCCKMRIWTRKSALIQPRTSLGKSVCVLANPETPASSYRCSSEHRSASDAQSLESARIAARSPRAAIRETRLIPVFTSRLTCLLNLVKF